MEVNIDVVAGLVTVTIVIGAIFVGKYQIAELERRVARLEDAERAIADRITRVETQLEMAVELLHKIATKLDVI